MGPSAARRLFGNGRDALDWALETDEAEWIRECNAVRQSAQSDVASTEEQSRADAYAKWSRQSAEFVKHYVLKLGKRGADCLDTLSDALQSFIVDRGDESWKGPVGMITELLPEVQSPAENTYAIVCGPPVMFKFVCGQLNRMGIPMDRMFGSLERRIHCGMCKGCRFNVG